MPPTLITGPQIYTETGIVQNGYLSFEKGKITIINSRSDSDNSQLTTHNFPPTYHLIPGFIDLQLHGVKARDVMDANETAYRTITENLPAEGTTSFLACTMTELDAGIQTVMRTLKTFCESNYQGAEILGIHLEGPFIAPKYIGAQRPDAVIAPNIELFKHWQSLSGDLIKIVTLATEQNNGLELTHYLSEQNVLTSFGHSEANYEQALAAINAGCTTATHLFNAMQGLHHRHPNAVTAMLLSETVIPQIIVDGVHLHPAIVKLIYQLKGREKIALVTDAMCGKACPDGEYELGGQTVIVKHGEARLRDGTLAGSVLTMRDAVINTMRFAEISFADALHMATTVPAKMLNIFDRKGSIAVGKDADLVVLDENYQVVMTFCRGHVAYQK